MGCLFYQSEIAMKQALVGVCVQCIVFKVDVAALWASRGSETNHPFKACETEFLKPWLKTCSLEACISLKMSLGSCCGIESGSEKKQLYQLWQTNVCVIY